MLSDFLLLKGLLGNSLYEFLRLPLPSSIKYFIMTLRPQRSFSRSLVVA